MAFAGLWTLQIYRSWVVRQIVQMPDEQFDLDTFPKFAPDKFPLIIFLGALFISFGVLGLFSNWLLLDVSSMSVVLKVSVSTFVAGTISWFGAIQYATLFVRKTIDQLPLRYIHCVGKVISEKITNEMSGIISVTDDVYGRSIRHRGRMAKGYDDLGHGAEIRVVAYDKNAAIYYCVPLSEWPRLS